MENNINNNITRNRTALVCMIIHVIVSSFVVFVIDWGETNQSPFLFGALQHFFSFFVFLSIVLIWRPKLFSKKVLRSIFKAPQGSGRMNLLLIPSIISGIATYPLLSISTRYIDIIPVVIIYEMSPLFLVLFSSLLFRKENRFKSLTIWIFILFALALAGFGFVTIGQSGVFPFQLGISGIILLGAVLALLAAFCNALSPSFSIRHAAIAHKKIKETGENIEEIYCTMFSSIIQRSIAGIVLLIIAFYLGEQLTTRVLLAGCLIGFLIVPLAVTTIRQANLLTNNLGINALLYTTPIFAILWLLLFRDPIFPQIDFLVIGVTAIIIANLLLTFGSKIRTGYKSLILLLWLCGTSVYLLLQNIGFYDYFNLI